MGTLPGLTEGRRTTFESETRFTRECYNCGAESGRVWRCTECGVDLSGRG